MKGNIWEIYRKYCSAAMPRRVARLKLYIKQGEQGFILVVPIKGSTAKHMKSNTKEIQITMAVFAEFPISLFPRNALTQLIIPLEALFLRPDSGGLG